MENKIVKLAATIIIGGTVAKTIKKFKERKNANEIIETVEVEASESECDERN